MITTCALIIFWAAVSLVVYTHIGYPFVLFIFYGLVQMRRDWQFLHHRRDRRRSDLADADLPTVTMLFAAYNEEEHLTEKIENTKQLNYPEGKLQVVIVFDGSS